MSFSPISFKTLVAALFMAAFDRNNGVFLSRASPVQETKTVGIQRVEPLSVSIM